MNKIHPTHESCQDCIASCRLEPAQWDIENNTNDTGKRQLVIHVHTHEKYWPELLDTPAAATFLGVSESFLKKSRSEGSPGTRTPAPEFTAIEGRRYYRRDDLTAWAANLRTQRVTEGKAHE